MSVVVMRSTKVIALRSLILYTHFMSAKRTLTDLLWTTVGVRSLLYSFLYFMAKQLWPKLKDFGPNRGRLEKLLGTESKLMKFRVFFQFLHSTRHELLQLLLTLCTHNVLYKSCIFNLLSICTLYNLWLAPPTPGHATCAEVVYYLAAAGLGSDG